MSLLEANKVAPRPQADRTTAKTLDLYTRLRNHLANAEVGMKRAAEALRNAAAEVKQEQVAGLEPGRLITFAATTEANAAAVERMGAHVEWLLSLEPSPHGHRGV